MGLSKAEIESRIKSLLGNPLFEAARLDDVGLMKVALAKGHSLNEKRPLNGFTPLHTAAVNGSVRFLKEALRKKRSGYASGLSPFQNLHAQVMDGQGSPNADTWIRDNKGMLPIDHAEVRRDREAQRLLFEAMYPDDRVRFRE
ncbi:MAG: ankyrin repeat domain-containing protein [Hyphomicrobium sp.]|nr:ankyrin repeat domain-containing protein [Hyphomicrobium sp.]